MSSPTVFDKAKYHYDGEWPQGLPCEQAFVHTGLFVGWLIDRDLVSELVDNSIVRDFKKRKLSGPAAYRLLDGVLDSTMLTVDGEAFCNAYFRLAQGGGRFAADYESELAAGLPSLYHV